MDNINIIEQIDSFYNSAWNKLIIVGTIALTIVGIIAPLIIQWYQKRTLKLSEESLRETICKEVEISKNQLKLEIEEIVNEKFKKVRRELKNTAKELHCNSEGGLYFVQGNNQLNSKEYFEATRSYAISMDCYRKGKNFVSIREILPNLIECLNKIKKTDIQVLKKEEDVDLEKILTKILNNDKYGETKNIIFDNIYTKYSSYFK